MVKLLIIVFLAAIVVGQSAFLVQQWEQGLILEFGKPIRIIQEPGLYFKTPFIQDLTLFEKRILAAEARPAEYITLDKKRLTVDTVSRWRISQPLLFYQTVRNYAGAIARLNDITFARLRQEIGNHNFKEFIREERERIMNQVTSGVEEQARRFGIEVIDVRIRRVDLPEEVQNSVFARMKAERERIAKRYRAEGDEQAREIRASADKDKEILLAEAYGKAQALKGEGEAESAKIYAEAYNKDIDFFRFVRTLESYKTIFKENTTFLLKPDSSLLRFLESPYGN
ncbi:MAG: protease modulator HflC [Desulfomonile sp.]|jgi:membrane protease subunit HflC